VAGREQAELKKSRLTSQIPTLTSRNAGRAHIAVRRGGWCILSRSGASL